METGGCAMVDRNSHLWRCPCWMNDDLLIVKCCYCHNRQRRLLQADLHMKHIETLCGGYPREAAPRSIFPSLKNEFERVPTRAAGFTIGIHDFHKMRASFRATDGSSRVRYHDL